MENVTDALKIAAAMLVFVVALGTAIYAFGKARETSDFVLAQTDPMQYVEYEQVAEDEETRRANKVRTVGLETIIPTLYKYYKEDYMVVFQNKNGQPLEIYKTLTQRNLWSKSYRVLARSRTR